MGNEDAFDFGARWTRGSVFFAGLLALCAAGCDEGRDGRSGVGQGIDLSGGGSDDEPDADTAGGDDAADDGGDDGDGPGEPEPDDDDPQPAAEPEPELPFDAGKLAEVCARGNADRVAQALCSGSAIESMTDLRDALAFTNPFFALTSNSSSLVARGVSAINPRLVVGEKAGGLFSDFGDIDQTMAMGFARGEQFVELVGYDPVAEDLNFYLLMFEQDCNDAENGCSTADLLTPAIENDWARWTVYQDVDLANKTVDCAVCHQPLGRDTPKILRMQEVNNSWTHWFPTRPAAQSGGWSSGGSVTFGLPPEDPESHGTRSSEVLWSMFERMHGPDGTYGGVSLDELSPATAGPDMESFVVGTNLSRDLPAPLDLPPGFGGGSGDYFYDSASSEVLGDASDWSQQYARVVSGERLPLPSYRIDVTDPQQRENAITSYLDVVGGAQPPETLVDVREVLSYDALTEMSVVPRQGASATEIITHMCSRCHNDRLDPDLSRARFDAGTLATMTAVDKLAIANRLEREHDDPMLMPPPRFATLPDWARQRVMDWVSQ